MARYDRRRRSRRYYKAQTNKSEEYKVMEGYEEMDYTNELEDQRRNATLPYMQLLRFRTCKKKSLSLTDAQTKVLHYHQRVVFATLNYYWCDRHKAWHVGHSNKRLSSALVLTRKRKAD